MPLKISDNLFLSHRSPFVYLSIFACLYYLKVLYTVYDPSLADKPLFHTKNSFVSPYFSHFVLSGASFNTTSPNIGETDAWAVSLVRIPQILGGPFLQSPLSLRPCYNFVHSQKNLRVDPFFRLSEYFCQ